MHLLPKLIELIESIPNETISMLLKKEEKTIAKHAMGKVGKEGFIYLLKTGQINILKGIYASIEIPLGILGCAGGIIGFAANVIDAVFCYLLGITINLAIDLISAFCMVPGVKGMLKIGEGASKVLVSLIKSNKQVCQCIDVFVAVVKRLRTKLNPLEFIPKLYDFYRCELRCSKKLIDDILNWIYQNSPKSFKVIEDNLKKGISNIYSGTPKANSVMNKNVGDNIGKRATAGEIAVEGQVQLGKDINYGTRNYFFLHPLYKNNPF